MKTVVFLLSLVFIVPALSWPFNGECYFISFNCRQSIILGDKCILRWGHVGRLFSYQLERLYLVSPCGYLQRFPESWKWFATPLNRNLFHLSFFLWHVISMKPFFPCMFSWRFVSDVYPFKHWSFVCVIFTEQIPDATIIMFMKSDFNRFKVHLPYKTRWDKTCGYYKNFFLEHWQNSNAMFVWDPPPPLPR